MTTTKSRGPESSSVLIQESNVKSEQEQQQDDDGNQEESLSSLLGNKRVAQNSKIKDDNESHQIARNALFVSVENNGDGDGDDDGDDFYDDNDTISYSLLRLFQRPKHSTALIVGHTIKQQQALLLNTIQHFHKGHARRFFIGLKMIVNNITSNEIFIPESAFVDNNDEDFEIQSDPKSTKALHYLKYAALCVKAYLEGIQQKFESTKKQLSIISEAYDVALLLHETLFSLQDCGTEGCATKIAIINLCEAWWHANAIQRETLILQCLPMMVLDTIDGNTFSKSNVKRLFKLRGAFDVIDFTDASSSSLRELLLRVVSNPLCLRMREGKNFLSSLLHDTSLISDIHKAVRVQIPGSKKTILRAYGEIYLKAWIDACDGPEIREEIEQSILQDLMYGVIHAASQTTTKSVLALLEPIHEAKKSKDVEDLLYRLYSPILWRSLCAPNPYVRMNAAIILAEVFPLQESSHTQTQAAVVKGTTALKSLLTDADPRVRVVGSEATARVCAMFWDVIPPEDIRILLNHIVVDHASDSTSAAVRAGALDSIRILLEVPQSHAVLRALLPSLGNLIHDKIVQVRLAAVRMLLRIKQVPGIRFYHVVPVDHLTSRLSEEGRLHQSPRNRIASELTALLLNSYLPHGPDVSGADQMKRTLSFLMTEPAASAVFYANLVNHLPLDMIAKFSSMLFACLVSSVEADQARQVKNSKGKKKRRRHSDVTSSEENSDTEQVLTAENTPLMASIAETIDILWESISEKSSKSNQNPLETLYNFSGKQLSVVLAHFDRKAAECYDHVEEKSTLQGDCHRICAAILRCAGRLSRDTIDEILPHISSTLSSLTDEDSTDKNISAHISLLCLWGMTESVAQSLALSIDSLFKDDIGLASPSFEAFGEDSSRRRSSRHQRKPSTFVMPVLTTTIAWQCIQDILCGADPTNTATRDSILSSEKGCKSLEESLQRSLAYAERLLTVDSMLGQSFTENEIEFVLSACEAYGRFVLHKQAAIQDSVSFGDGATQLLHWTTQKVLPAIRKYPGENTLRDLDLSRISVSDSLVITGSPIAASSSSSSPPRQRADLRGTPGRSETHRISFSRGSRGGKEPVTFFARDAAVSLLQSSCILFAEWLAVGGLGGELISQAAIEWYKELTGSKEKQESLPQQVYVTFVRLAVQLCQNVGEFGLFKAIIVTGTIDSETAASTVMKKATSMLILNKAQHNNIEAAMGAIEVIFQVAKESLERDGVSFLSSIPDSIQAYSGLTGDSIKDGLSVMMSNKNARQQFFKVLVKDLVEAFASRKDDSGNLLFDVKCLSVIIQEDGLSTEQRGLIDKLDITHIDSGSELYEMVTKLVESKAAA